MTRKTLSAILAASLLAIALPSKAKDYEFATSYDGLPFEMPRVERPSIPNNVINIKDLGAVNDGRTLNTEVFAKAMKQSKKHGGARIVVPAGIWLTGPIEFENNTELHLEQGALLLFTDDRTQYPLIDGNFEGLESKRCQSPLSAHNKHDIAITGTGSIDGNGQVWRPVKKMKLTDRQWKDLIKSGGVVNELGTIWYINDHAREVSEDPTYMQQARIDGSDSAWAFIHDYLRPVLVSIVGCKNVLLEDATFENSPAWNIHPLLCQNVIINNVTVRNPWWAQNGDGLDIESCTNVLVRNSSFDVGDDAICIKSGRDKEGRERGVPTSNLIVDGCVVYHGHGGFVIGSEMSGGANNIMVRNCLFSGTDVGLRFKSTRGRGGLVENIWIDNVNMTKIAGEALIFDLFYAVKAEDPIPPASEETPEFRNIIITNTTCQQSKRSILFNGLPELPLTNVTLRNCRLHGVLGAAINQSRHVTLENVVIECEQGDRLKTRNSSDIIEK